MLAYSRGNASCVRVRSSRASTSSVRRSGDEERRGSRAGVDGPGEREGERETGTSDVSSAVTTSEGTLDKPETCISAAESIRVNREWMENRILRDAGLWSTGRVALCSSGYVLFPGPFFVGRVKYPEIIPRIPRLRH